MSSARASMSNPFPPHRRGLWRVRAVPVLYKTSDLIRRWRALKAAANAAGAAS